MENKSTQILINQVYNIISDILKKWQLIILVTVVFALGFDTYRSITYTPMYRCEATFAVKSGSSSSVTTTTDSSENEEVGETFTYIFSSNVFKKQIQNALGVDNLNGNYYAEIYTGTNILHVYAESSSIHTAYSMMSALMDNYEDISMLVVGSANIDVLKDATVPTTPYNALNHKRNIILAGGFGFILCIFILAALSFLNNTVKDKEEAERKTNLHLIGVLPKESKYISLKQLKKKDSILVSQYSTSFQYVESFKRIRSRIERYAKKHNAKAIMITSSLENEGKSSVSINTALTFGMNHKNVLLIDADLRKPSQQGILKDVKHEYGLEHVLFNNIPLEKAIVELPQYKIDILYGYGEAENINDAFPQEAMKKLLSEAKEKYDYIIIDSAPSRYLSDSSNIAALVDGIVLVVKQNYANVSTINDTIDKLSISGTSIIGCILNQSISFKIETGKYYGYKYGYSHYYNRRKGDE